MMDKVEKNSNEAAAFYAAAVNATELKAEELLGVSPPLNVKLENPASLMDLL